MAPPRDRLERRRRELDRTRAQRRVKALNESIRCHLRAAELLEAAAERSTSRAFAQALRDRLGAHDRRLAELRWEVQLLGGLPAAPRFWEQMWERARVRLASLRGQRHLLRLLARASAI